MTTNTKNTNVTAKEVTGEQMINLLNNTVNTLNPNGKGDTFWLSRIVENWHERAAGFAMSTLIKGYSNALSRLDTQLNGCQGIVNYFNLDITPDLAYTIANADKSSDMTLEGNMMQKIGLFPRTYGIDKDSIPEDKRQDAIDELSFDITEADMERAKRENNVIAREYAKENRISIRKQDPKANNLPKMAEFAIENELFEMVPPLSAYEFLEFKAQQTVDAHNEKVSNAISTVVKHQENMQYGKDFGNVNAVHEVPENELYWWVVSFESTIGRALESAKRKLEKAEGDNNKSNMITFAGEIGGLELIKIEANELIHKADEVDNTNTSQEIIDATPTSNNLAENATHDYEVANNLPH